ncbi:MAG: hypothetical protein ACI80K_004835, partial [Paracoccaceae bacterium]
SPMRDLGRRVHSRSFGSGTVLRKLLLAHQRQLDRLEV